MHLPSKNLDIKCVVPGGRYSSWAGLCDCVDAQLQATWHIPFPQLLSQVGLREPVVSPPDDAGDGLPVSTDRVKQLCWSIQSFFLGFGCFGTCITGFGL